MGLLLKQIFQLIKLLNSENGTLSVALGFTLGFILGMTPAFSLQTILVFLVLFVFRIQMGAAFVSAFFFSFAAYLLDPVFHDVGENILSNPFLKPLFTQMYNMPIVPLTRFYNTIVMGAGVVALTLSPIFFILSYTLIKKYKKTVVERFKQTKFFKVMKATAIYKWYHTYDSMFGE